MRSMMGRRAALALISLPGLALAAPGTRVQVWRDPNCGCCGGWIAHLRTAGFVVEDR